LKQAPLSWFLKLSHTLHTFGFTSTKSDTFLFARFTSSHIIFVLVCVDDILIIGSSPSEINKLISNLNACFSLKDLDDLHHFLGIQVTRTSTGDMHLSQTQYIRELLSRIAMASSNPQPTPMVSTLRLQQNSSDAFHDLTLYKSVVGALQYLLVTCPELFMAKVLWIQSLLHELHIPTSIPQMFFNNLSVVLLSVNLVMHSKCKHFELDLHFVRDNVQTQQVQLLHIPARYQDVDLLTKHVSGATFLQVRNKLKIVSTMSLRV